MNLLPSGYRGAVVSQKGVTPISSRSFQLTAGYVFNWKHCSDFAYEVWKSLGILGNWRETFQENNRFM